MTPGRLVPLQARSRPLVLLRHVALAGLVLAALLSPAGCSDDDSSTAAGLAPEQLYRACLRTAACGIKAQPRLSNCVDYYLTTVTQLGWRPIYDAIYRCVNEAGGDCEAIHHCFGSHPAAGSCDQSYQAHCDGSRALTCDLLDHKVYAYDCSLAGQSCDVKQGASGFEASCGEGSCDSNTFRPWCEGTRLLSCTQGVISAQDCAHEAMVCDASGPTARCVGAEAEACDEQTYASRCEGSVALGCAGGKLRREDCALRFVNRRCDGGRCVPSATACKDEFNRCTGPTLEACVDGAWITFDCQALGLGPCASQTYGAACTTSG